MHENAHHANEIKKKNNFSLEESLALETEKDSVLPKVTVVSIEKTSRLLRENIKERTQVQAFEGRT